VVSRDSKGTDIKPSLRTRREGFIRLGKQRFGFDCSLVKHEICDFKLMINICQEFESVECEWPLFYVYMVIDGMFKGLTDEVERYQSLLKQVIYKDANGG
jgi:hypothetical protein